jgi:hypothetical protein
MSDPIENLPPTPDLSQDENPEQDSRRLVIPLWVAIATLILALLIAGIIINQIATPLGDLIFGQDPDIPIPKGAKLIEEREGGSAAKEWLYHIDKNGCEVAQFYQDQEGVECNFTGFSCTEIPDSGSQAYQIGACTFTETNSISGYSWHVDITQNQEDSRIWTSFRVYLYDR